MIHHGDNGDGFTQSCSGVDTTRISMWAVEDYSHVTYMFDIWTLAKKHDSLTLSQTLSQSFSLEFLQSRNRWFVEVQTQIA